MAQEGTWRKNLFKADKKYRIIKDWSFFGSQFKTDDIVVFESCSYERYDSETLFRFKRADSARVELIWRLRDNEPDSMVNEYFSEVEK